MKGANWKVVSRGTELYFLKTGNLEEVRVLCLRSMTWRRAATTAETKPEPRSKASVTAFNDSVVVVGGLAGNGKAMADAWKLDLEKLEWRKVDDLKSLKPRFNHTGIQITSTIFVDIDVGKM